MPAPRISHQGGRFAGDPGDPGAGLGPVSALSSLEASWLAGRADRGGLEALTARASQLVGASGTQVSLVTDQEEFLLGIGGPGGFGEPAALRRPLAGSLSERLLARRAPVVVEDTRCDEPLAPGPAIDGPEVGAWAGFALRAPEGYPLGSFCAIDVAARPWSEHELRVLEALAEAASTHLTQQREQLRLTRAREDLVRVIGNVTDYLRTVEILPDGRVVVIYASASSRNVFGGEPPTGPDSQWTLGDLVHPEDQILYREFHRKVIAGESAELECRVIGLDGVTRWVWTRALRRVEDGRTFVDGISSNITARRQGEIELEEERRRLRLAQSIGRIGSWEWDAVTGDVTWSPTQFELYGVNPDLFTALAAWQHILHPEDVGQVREQFLRSARTGEPIHFRYRVIRPADGALRVFEARGEALFDAGARVARLAGTARDITEQVNAERETAGREAMLRAILARSHSLIYVKRLDGRYLLANETLLRARGLTEAELIGKDDMAIDPVQAPLWQANDRRARQGEFAVQEWINTRQGRRCYHSVKFPLLDGEGRVYATCGISLDVTATHRAAEALEAARGGLLAALELIGLLRESRLDPQQGRYLEELRGTADGVLAILQAPPEGSISELKSP